MSGRCVSAVSDAYSLAYEVAGHSPFTLTEIYIRLYHENRVRDNFRTLDRKKMPLTCILQLFQTPEDINHAMAQAGEKTLSVAASGKYSEV